MLFFLKPGSDICDCFACMFLVFIDGKFAGDYNYVSKKLHTVTCSEIL